jgi:hypothetical protein
MARQKKIYTNRQKRGGTSPRATDSSFGSAENRNRSPKKYHRQAVSHHGSESAVEELLKKIKKGPAS